MKKKKIITVAETGNMYPLYPVNEDIYKQFKEEVNIDPENIDLLKSLNEQKENDYANEKNFVKNDLGRDLDVPNAELDDELEVIGSEDEENNYYSIGGDDHNNLDENRN